MSVLAPFAIESVIALRPSATAPLAGLLPAARDSAAEQLGRMDRLCGLAVVGSEICLAGLDPSWREQAAQTAVLCGSRDGCLATDTAFFRGVLAGEASPRLFAYTLHSAPVGAVSIQHGLLGPGATAVGSVTSGLQALEEATLLLAAGQARACLVLSCDVAWEPGHDVVAALFLTPRPTAARASQTWGLLAVRSAFCAGQPQRALAQVVDGLRAQRVLPASAVAVPAEEPPLSVLARLASAPAQVHPGLADAGADTVLLTCVDDQGYAAAVVLARAAVPS